MCALVTSRLLVKQTQHEIQHASWTWNELNNSNFLGVFLSPPGSLSALTIRSLFFLRWNRFNKIVNKFRNNFRDLFLILWVWWWNSARCLMLTPINKNSFMEAFKSYWNALPYEIWCRKPQISLRSSFFGDEFYGYLLMIAECAVAYLFFLVSDAREEKWFMTRRDSIDDHYATQHTNDFTFLSTPAPRQISKKIYFWKLLWMLLYTLSNNYPWYTFVTFVVFAKWMKMDQYRVAKSSTRLMALRQFSVISAVIIKRKWAAQYYAIENVAFSRLTVH